MRAFGLAYARAVCAAVAAQQRTHEHAAAVARGGRCERAREGRTQRASAVQSKRFVLAPSQQSAGERDRTHQVSPLVAKSVTICATASGGVSPASFFDQPVHNSINQGAKARWSECNACKRRTRKRGLTRQRRLDVVREGARLGRRIFVSHSWIPMKMLSVSVGLFRRANTLCPPKVRIGRFALRFNFDKARNQRKAKIESRHKRWCGCVAMVTH